MLLNYETDRIYEQVQHLTMTKPEGIARIAGMAATLTRVPVKGCIVECGTWRGGGALAMMLGQKIAAKDKSDVRALVMFDSFEGMPEPGDIDGPKAWEYWKNRDSPTYFNNCKADEAQCRADMAAAMEPLEYCIVAGRLENTLPQFLQMNQQIALLRIDCDWYKSVKLCLDLLMPLVSHNGLVVIDDYYAWDGCAMALHEWLAASRLPYRLHSIGHAGVFFRKGFD